MHFEHRVLKGRHARPVRPVGDRRRSPPQPHDDLRGRGLRRPLARPVRRCAADARAGQHDEGLLVRQGQRLDLPLQQERRQGHAQVRQGGCHQGAEGPDQGRPGEDGRRRDGPLRDGRRGVQALPGAVRRLPDGGQHHARPDAGVLPGQAGRPAEVQGRRDGLRRAGRGAVRPGPAVHPGPALRADERHERRRGLRDDPDAGHRADPDRQHRARLRVQPET